MQLYLTDVANDLRLETVLDAGNCRGTAARGAGAVDEDGGSDAEVASRRTDFITGQFKSDIKC